MSEKSTIRRPIADAGHVGTLPDEQQTWEMVEKIRVGAACAPLNRPAPAETTSATLVDLVDEYMRLPEADRRLHQLAISRAELLSRDIWPKDIGALSRSDLQVIAKIAWGTSCAYAKVSMDGFGAGTWDQITVLRISLTTVVMMLHRQMVEGYPSPDRRVWDQASVNNGSSGWLLARVFIETAWGLIKVWTEDADHYRTRFDEKKQALPAEPAKGESKPVSIEWILVDPSEKIPGAKLVKSAELRDKVLRVSKEIRDQYFGGEGAVKGCGIYEVGEPVDLYRTFTCGKYQVKIPVIALL